MRALQNAVLEALRRVQRFFEEYAAVLTGLIDLTVARKRLDDVVSSFTDHAFDQDANDRGAKGETARQRDVRIKLRAERMNAIAFIARRNLRSTPQFAALQLPKPTVHGQAFLASAKAMAAAATIHKDTLIAHGLPSTFLDDFTAAITTLDNSMGDREQNHNRRLAATKGLDAEEKQGRLVLSVLDRLLKPALADNDALLRAWQGARHIRRRTGPATAASAGPKTTGPAAPVATPAPATSTTPPVAAA
jgi:hypothetical protein